MIDTVFVVLLWTIAACFVFAVAGFMFGSSKRLYALADAALVTMFVAVLAALVILLFVGGSHG